MPPTDMRSSIDLAEMAELSDCYRTLMGTLRKHSIFKHSHFGSRLLSSVYTSSGLPFSLSKIKYQENCPEKDMQTSMANLILQIIVFFLSC